MISLISPLILIAIGITLIALETLTFTFVMAWFGISFIIVGVLSFMPIFPDGLWQLSVISILSILLLITLRSKILKIFLKPKENENNDDFFNEQGIGVIKSNKVYYKATYWDIDLSDNLTYEENEKVNVIEIKKGTAYIKKMKKEE